MKIAVSSDEKTPLTDFVIDELTARGHEVTLFGPLINEGLALDAGLGKARGFSCERPNRAGRTVLLHRERAHQSPPTKFRASGPPSVAMRRQHAARNGGMMPMC